MVQAHKAIAFWHHFHPRITKNMDLETVSHFGTQKHEKVTKCDQSGSQETPKMHPKIDKINNWTSRCLLGVPVDPWITKKVTQDTKMKPRGLQNNSFGYNKLPISAVHQSAVAC